MGFSPILRLATDWVNAHKYYSVEFEGCSLQSWVFLRTWDKNCFRHVCVAVMHKLTCDAINELGLLGQFSSGMDATVPIVLILGGFNLRGEVYAAYIGSGNQKRKIDFQSSIFVL